MADLERSHVDSHRERLFHTPACLQDDMAGSSRALGSREPFFLSRACSLSLSPSPSHASRVSPPSLPRARCLSLSRRLCLARPVTFSPSFSVSRD